MRSPLRSGCGAVRVWPFTRVSLVVPATGETTHCRPATRSSTHCRLSQNSPSGPNCRTRTFPLVRTRLQRTPVGDRSLIPFDPRAHRWREAGWPRQLEPWVLDAPAERRVRHQSAKLAACSSGGSAISTGNAVAHVGVSAGTASFRQGVAARRGLSPSYRTLPVVAPVRVWPASSSYSSTHSEDVGQ